jgi:hypothetical protein
MVLLLANRVMGRLVAGSILASKPLTVARVGAIPKWLKEKAIVPAHCHNFVSMLLPIFSDRQEPRIGKRGAMPVSYANEVSWETTSAQSAYLRVARGA